MYLIKEYESHSYPYYTRRFIHLHNKDTDIAVYFFDERGKHHIVSRKYFMKHLNLGNFFAKEQRYTKTLPEKFQHLKGKIT